MLTRFHGIIMLSCTLLNPPFSYMASKLKVIHLSEGFLVII